MRRLEINIAQQTWYFLYSLALGAGLGLFYDIFRVLRIALPHKTGAVLAEDIAFWSGSALATFLFFLAIDGGEIRLFLLIGEGIGFILYYFTIGVLVIGAARGIIGAIRWVFRVIYRVLIHPVLSIICKIQKAFQKIYSVLAFYIKKQAGNSNMHLKKYRRLLYNQKRKLQNHISKGRAVDESCKSTKE